LKRKQIFLDFAQLIEVYAQLTHIIPSESWQWNRIINANPRASAYYTLVSITRS